ncbi:MAG: B12-binding domain-containing radical SAM protein [Firmicutes bacterium]|nr:B12-binding domain-containing radical SAM protein [Bacillota bacterium]
MKVLFVAVNAKYIHSNLAVRYLQRYCRDIADCRIMEFTINGFVPETLREIYRAGADAVFFSCYLWNISFISEVAEDLKKVAPGVKIVLGGPEVSFSDESFLDENPFVDFVTIGEGEIPTRRLIEFMKGEIPIEEVPSVIYRDEDGAPRFNRKTEVLPMDEIPFPYESLAGMEHKIIYYETQRGCPFSCKYCLSSVAEGVRFMSRERVRNDLDFFLREAPTLVKFVDRTFNCNGAHSRFIWEYLIAHDNGKTCFHMEIKGELLRDEDFAILEKARDGLFRFEIGVQTGNEAVLYEIARVNKKSLLYENSVRVIGMGNIHTHLDLIAGLPGEDFASFANSFNEVYSLDPHELQLGFLKLLKGSDLRINAEKLGIVYSRKAPYEVLYTNEISYAELMRLKRLENVLEIFYNSGKAAKTFRFCGQFFDSPFEMYDKLGEFWESKGYDVINLTKDDTYGKALEFFETAPETAEASGIIREMLFLDYLLQSKSYKTPVWAKCAEDDAVKKKKTELLRDKNALESVFPELAEINPKDIPKHCRTERFFCDVLSENPQKSAENKWVLISYYKGIKACYIDENTEGGSFD